MSVLLGFALGTTALAAALVFTFIFHHLSPSRPVQTDEKLNRWILHSDVPPESLRLSHKLSEALPDCTILPSDDVAFRQSMRNYWAQQESEVSPACVVRPRTVDQLCTVVRILKREHDRCRRSRRGSGQTHGLFALRSGGHSPVSGAASIAGGVLVDLSRFDQVTPSQTELSVTVGTGAKWMDVSKALDEKALAVVGGRNSAVGVGGLTLGGGLSFFSPLFGLVCSNVISYEVVLANGQVIVASESTAPDLWRALKGGSNNFGIVTSFQLRTFPCDKIWSGFLYMPSFQTHSALVAFHDFLLRADSGDNGTAYDEHAAGPIVTFSYVQAIRTTLVSANIVYTRASEGSKQWPDCWKSSKFASLWRLWSTCRVRSLTSATDELNSLNPPGRRQMFGTTTIKNDLETLKAVDAANNEALTRLRPARVKGLAWTLIMQPLLPIWVRKGDFNPLGLHDGADDPLVVVSYSINWDESRHDDLVRTTARRAIEQMESFATAHRTAHPWRYLNYCAEWQRPFESYGQENLTFLRRTSRIYDPDGLFQTGCIGGFKLNIPDDKIR